MAKRSRLVEMESALTSYRVIVPVHNGTATLARCLNALIATGTPPSQVLVVDDCSSDGSAAIAEDFAVEVLQLSGGPHGPGVARNRAAAELEVEAIVFVDSDVVVRPDAIRLLLLALCQEQDVGAAFGSYDDTPEGKRLPGKYANLRHHHTHQHANRNAVTFWAGLGVVHTEAFRSVGGFRKCFSKPSIEDIDLGYRLSSTGYQIRCVPEAQATHLKDWTLANLWRTDIFQRAIPWSRLIVAGSVPAATLNTSKSQRFAALAACGSLLSIGLSLLFSSSWMIAFVLCLLAWIFLNRSFLALLYRRLGPIDMLGSALLHYLYYLYSTFAYLGVWIVDKLPI